VRSTAGGPSPASLSLPSTLESGRELQIRMRYRGGTIAAMLRRRLYGRDSLPLPLHNIGTHCTIRDTTSKAELLHS
jgi:hypothetical protein